MFLSFEFWIFVFITLTLHSLTRGRLQNVILLVASYGIYFYFEWRFLAILVSMTIANYLIGLKLELGNPRRRTYFFGAILLDLSVLAIFKYLGFFDTLLASGLTRLGIPIDAALLNLIMPLGISFYTFRLLSYVFDVYNGRVSASRRFDELALYIAFFPQLVAGPIERAANFLPRVRTTRTLTENTMITSATFIFVGIFYKIAIADPLVLSTEMAFSAIGKLSAPDALAAIILYSVRLYADFAGYSAMAIGISLLFGLPAMENFRQPYFSRSIVEFWNRWHISLSSWLRDYFFFPVSRFFVKRFGYSFAIQTACLFVTMVLIGIWHGSSLTFVVWGTLHGLYMTAERLFGRFRPPMRAESNVWQQRVEIVGDILVTQLFVAIAWVFFRAPTLNDAFLLFNRLLAANYSLDPTWWLKILTPVFLVFAFDLLQTQGKSLMAFWNLKLVWRTAILTALIIVLIIFGGTAHTQFVYAGF